MKKEDLRTPPEENQCGPVDFGHRGSRRYRSGVCVCVCVWPVLGFTWCLTYETDTRKDSCGTVREA